MNLYSSDIEVWQVAFPLAGANTPTATTDQTAEAVVANAVYEAIVTEALTMHGWSFALKTSALTRDAETNLSPAYTYPFPSDLLLLRYVQLDTAYFEEYVVRGNKLWADLDTTDFTAFYTYRASETEWPADFAWGIILRLAAAIARGLLDKMTLAERLEAQGWQALRNARARERATHRGPMRQPSPPLVAAWRGNTTIGALSGEET